MQAFINKLLDEFEKGKLSRRKLIETLAVSAMTIYTARPSGTARSACGCWCSGARSHPPRYLDGQPYFVHDWRTESGLPESSGLSMPT